MARIFSARFSGVTLTSATAQDAFSLKASATCVGRLIGLYLSQTVKAQDANDAQIGYTVKYGATTQGSGGSTPTPGSGRDTLATSGMTVHANDTTLANTGTIVTLHDDAFNDRAGLVFIPTPEISELLRWGGAAACLVIGIDAPSQTYTSGFKGTIIWEES